MTTGAYRIPKITVPVVCYTSHSEIISGEIFLDPMLTEGYSIAQMLEFFNGEPPYFPIRTTSGTRPALLQKESVVRIDIPQLLDQFREQELSATPKQVLLYLNSVGRLSATVMVDMPEEHQRVLDVMNLGKVFFPALVNDSLALLNAHHLYKIEET